MNIIGIICEYNPFHNGHLYHLKKIKEMFPDSLIVLVLNGYFLERGDISIISKKDKTKIALNNGIDIVLELPFVYGTQSADIFGSTSIKILNELKIDYLVFGSECNDIKLLNEMCDYSINNKEKYDEDVKSLLDKGVNYPTAMGKALNKEFTFNSNDLLGISYIKAIKTNKYNIKPLTIKRTNNYLDKTSQEDIISANNIREKIKNKENITKFIPKGIKKYINNISLNDFFSIIKYKIITCKDLNKYLDVDEGIENRLKKVILDVSSIDELLDKVKSKRYTYNKLRRMLIHILLDFTKEDNKRLKLDYIKVLGFSSLGKKYLNNIKKELSIPITVNKESIIYKYELNASRLYDMVTTGDNSQFETSNKPIS